MRKNTAPHSATSFGIDHPLIAVHDIEALRQRLIGLGFNMTAIGKHPWGTSTSLAIFPDCLLEIMGIYDKSLLDEKPTGDFRFGRHVYKHLQQREGVALTALHSTGSTQDAHYANTHGFELAGHLEFGRDVTLPNGGADRTKTTLALLPDTSHPRLSFFLCQQHRRDLVEVPQWMQHPNTVCGISGVTVMASPEQQPDIRKKLGALYGNGKNIDGGFCMPTPNGTIYVLNHEAIAEKSGIIPDAVLKDKQVAIVGIEFCCKNLTILESFLTRADIATQRKSQTIILSNASLTGNTLFTFCQS